MQLIVAATLAKIIQKKDAIYSSEKWVHKKSMD